MYLHKKWAPAPAPFVTIMAGYIAQALSIANDAVPARNDVVPVMTPPAPPVITPATMTLARIVFIHPL